MLLKLLVFIGLAMSSLWIGIGEKNPQTFQYRHLKPNEKAVLQTALKQAYQLSLLSQKFNGSILVAKNGEILLEAYHGYYNYTTATPLNEHSTFHLASTSKPFTAMAILHLREQRLINLNDLVTKFLPSFPYPTITIENLLTHRSGLASYLDFTTGIEVNYVKTKNKKHKTIYKKHVRHVRQKITGFLTNEGLLAYMVQYKIPLEAEPNTYYKYCNTNYAMLALVIEKIVGMPFPQYMKDSLFTMLGMQDTYVFSIKDTNNYTPSYRRNGKAWNMDNLDCIYGDKNVYSTVRDLLKWDNALYNNLFIHDTSLALAYKPYSFEHPGKLNYGLGWHLILNDDQTQTAVPYHNGWWHGNNNVFMRLIQDTAVIIILGNKLNRKNYTAGKKIATIFNRDFNIGDDSSAMDSSVLFVPPPLHESTD